MIGQIKAFIEHRCARHLTHATDDYLAAFALSMTIDH
jgi:hypothetical protein